jgi:hypothetical protein
MRRAVVLLGPAALVALSGCAVVVPTAPSVLVVPKTAKPLASFQAEDAYCRSVAYNQVGASRRAQSASQSATGTAVLGGATGAAAGAAIGSLGARAGAGALIGATYGLLVGGVMAARQASAASSRLQYDFDTIYTQCMYSYENNIAPAVPPVAYYGTSLWYYAY